LGGKNYPKGFYNKRGKKRVISEKVENNEAAKKKGLLKKW